MKRVFFSFLLVSVISTTALAQTTNTTSPTSTPVSEPENTDRSAAAGVGKRWSFFLTFAGGFDSNINHDQDDINDYGAVVGAGVYFRNKAERPNFEFMYEVGRHQYAQTSKWNRTSHNIQVRSENRLGKRWVSETSGEISLKGSTEDRELTDRYSISQFFQYRFTRSHRLNFGGTYRLKRYPPTDRQRNSTNPYLEAGYETRFGNGRRKLEFSYRYEENRARNDRYSYIRWSYGVQFETPLFKKARLLTDLRYRPQKHARLVEIELPDGSEIDVPRRDKRWIFGAEWRRIISPTLELGVLYKYEQRDSNDPDRNFKAHALGAVMTYRFWR